MFPAAESSDARAAPSHSEQDSFTSPAPESSDTRAAPSQSERHSLTSPAAEPPAAESSDRCKKHRASYTWKSVDSNERYQFRGPPRDTVEKKKADETLLRSQIAGATSLADASKAFESLQKSEWGKVRDPITGQFVARSAAPEPCGSESLPVAMARNRHQQTLERARASATMSCFNLAVAHFRLLNHDSVNPFPGFRNIGNTCWLNSLLQCVMHTTPLRDACRSPPQTASHLRKALQYLVRLYWADGAYVHAKHAILVPLEMLEALLLVQPHLGGAIQQDTGDAFQFFGLESCMRVPLVQSAETVSSNGVLQAFLPAYVLEGHDISLPELIAIALPPEHVDGAAGPCIVLTLPTVYERHASFHYASCRLQDFDASIDVGGAAYFLRAYIEHRHHGKPRRNSRVGGHYAAYFKNNGMWYVADDTVVLEKSNAQAQRGLPAMLFLEQRGNDPGRAHDESNPVAIAPLAPRRAPTWLDDALWKFASQQLDAEMLLSLPDEQQVQLAQAVSVVEAGASFDGALDDDLLAFVGKAARGTEHGAFEIHAECGGDGEGEVSGSDITSAEDSGGAARTSNPKATGTSTAAASEDLRAVIPIAACEMSKPAAKATPPDPKQKRLDMFGVVSRAKPEGVSGAAAVQPAQRQRQSMHSPLRKRRRTGQQQDRTDRAQQRDRTNQAQQQDRTDRAQQRDRTNLAQQHDRTDRAQQDRMDGVDLRSRRGAEQERQAKSLEALHVSPVELYKASRECPRPAKEREELRAFLDTEAAALSPVWCLLCDSNFVCREDFCRHVQDKHGGLQRYRHRVLHLFSLQPFCLTPDIARNVIANFAEFYCRGSLDWDDFTPEMRSLLNTSSGLPPVLRWTPRRMMACVCCARLFWPEDLVRAHLVGPHSDWLRKPAVVWKMLSVKAYHTICRRIPMEELLASSVRIGDEDVLLHSRRCSPSVLDGTDAAPWCADCHRALKQEKMPKCALANLNWLGRLTDRQLRLLQPDRLGHRLLLQLARVVTTKLVFRPAGAASRGAFWQEAFHTKGMKGSAIVVDQATKYFSRTFPPRSLDGTFVAVFAGPDDADDVDMSFFGTVNAVEFRSDAEGLRAVNETYASATMDEEELSSWKGAYFVPASLRSCCARIEVPSGNDAEDDAPALSGPAQATSGQEEGDRAFAPPYISALGCAEGESEAVPLLWSQLGERLEEAVALGDRIRAQELHARIAGSQHLQDELQREKLLQICVEVKQNAKKLSLQAQQDNFERLCAKILRNESTHAPGEDAPSHETLSPRLVVPTRRQALSLFDHEVWTKMSPVCFWYGDACWGHPRRPLPLSVAEFVEMLLRREELDYRTPSEIAANVVRKLPGENRFRLDCNYPVLHVLRTFWDLHHKIRSVYSFTARRQNAKSLRTLSQLTPQTLADCYTTVAEHKNLGAAIRDPNVPSVVRNALDTMQVATSDVLDTDGHRRLLRHEGVALAARFGASAIFLTPNLAQHRHVTILLTRSDVEHAELRLDVDCPEIGTLGDMMKICGSDPVGVAFADDLMFRLFQLFLVGIQHDRVGVRRGRAPPFIREAVWDTSAAATSRLGIFGPPLAAQGPLEGSGRAALHGHWRIWLRAIGYQRLLELLRQQPSLVQVRLRAATTDMIRSIMSTQQSSVRRLPRLFDNDVDSPAPLPLLASQHLQFGADGRLEVEDDGTESSVRRPLLACDPQYPPDGSQDASTRHKHPYKRPLMETAVSSQPKYRRLGALFSQPQTSQPRDTASGRTGAESANHAADAHALDVEAAESKDLRALSHALEPAVLHVSSAEWRERFGRDAWDLVLRTILHKCGESCWKYSKKGFKVCRHNMFHFICHDGLWNGKTKRREGKRLRNVISIEMQEQGGMRGRLYTFQDHPFEGPTNYVGLVAIRCNLDVQDLRQVLPAHAPASMPSTESQPDWAWMDESGGACLLKKSPSPPDRHDME